MAYKLKEYDRAYDLLISKSDKPSHRLNSKVCSNMTLAIQIETRKLEEATISFRALLNRDSHNSQQKPSICFDIVKMYSDAIKKEKNNISFVIQSTFRYTIHTQSQIRLRGCLLATNLTFNILLSFFGIDTYD